jgi:hypothetical protein
MHGNDEKKLIGLTITSFNLTPSGKTVTLHTTKGDVTLECGADCCSESWIEHLSIPKLPATILSIEDKDFGRCDSDGTRQEYDQKYSTILKTDQGDFEIEYRNSSNGYYGGWLELRDYPEEHSETLKG